MLSCRIAGHRPAFSTAGVTLAWACDRSAPRWPQAARVRSERIAARRERRDTEARTGARKYRPGPGRGIYSPWMSVSSHGEPDRELDAKIERLAQAVQERGPLKTRQLGELLGARYWGPGRFRTAVREAEHEGRLIRLPHGRVGPPAED